MASSSDEKNISLKLLVDTEKNEVAFAEADYRFVDILFSFMTLPMATIIRLSRKDSDQKFEALGSLITLYQGVANLPTECFASEECKSMLLNPGNQLERLCKKLKLNVHDTEPTKYFTCQSSCRYFTIYQSTECCNCRKLMDKEIILRLTDSSSNNWYNDGVFVNDMITFIVTDDLRVMPSTTVSRIQLLKDLGLTDSSLLEERTVDIGLDEIRDLLKCVLSCKSPLSYLFLPKTNVSQNLVSSEQVKSDQLLNNSGTATSSNKMTLKFIFQKSTGMLLFVEADDDFIDLVISFLAFPLGTVIGKLNGNTSLGSVDNLYTSISNMCARRCMKSQNLKNMLLQPHSVQQNHYGIGSIPPVPICQKGFVKGPSIFMVTDDLVINPLSSMSSINFLNKLKELKVPFRDIEEHDVCIGMEEGLAILKASLKSLSALSDGLKLLLKKPKQEL